MIFPAFWHQRTQNDQGNRHSRRAAPSLLVVPVVRCDCNTASAWQAVVAGHTATSATRTARAASHTRGSGCNVWRIRRIRLHGDTGMPVARVQDDGWLSPVPEDPVTDVRPTIAPAALRQLEGKNRRGGWPGQPKRWRTEEQCAHRREVKERARMRKTVRNMAEIWKRFSPQDASPEGMADGE